MQYVVRRQVIGSFEAIFSTAEREGTKYAKSLGVEEFEIAYGEFVHVKDALVGRVEDGTRRSVPEFKVTIKITMKK